ncbi:hypothetical protein F511_24786 [Dorcoceras hygrometricum]|uniref:Uncharacterized protein n=1 Tax=Dorcoceras hygrometricum TaxID=472368 RepID=A0A2Z7AIN7_9LAMI|nr:hypothetical protein F511_24786 [Dorcoceras hygrometricum]
MREKFAEMFGLPMEGITSFSNLPSKPVEEMKVVLSLSAKAGSFDVVTVECFDVMVAISTGLRINWSSVLFRNFTDMFASPVPQSQGYTLQIETVVVTTIVEEPVLVNFEEQCVAVDEGEVDDTIRDMAIIENPHLENSVIHWSCGPATKTIKIKEINWVTHFLPKIYLAAMGKEFFVALDRSNPVEEHCLEVTCEYCD